MMDGLDLILVPSRLRLMLRLLDDPRPSSGTVHRVCLRCQLSRMVVFPCLKRSSVQPPMEVLLSPVVVILSPFSRRSRDLPRSYRTSALVAVLHSSSWRASNSQELLLSQSNENQWSQRIHI